MAKHRGIWPVTWMCGVLDVSPSGYYGWLKRPLSARARYDAELTKQIHLSFTESDGTYGVRRVWPDLLAWGYVCGRERVGRLMRCAGLVARPKQARAPKDTGDRPESAIAPNTLARDFSAPTPNTRWVADFTYVRTLEGWLFVAVVLDLFSRRVVGWSMKSRMTADLVTDALIMAIWRRRPSTSLLHHSDQGSQYTSDDFQRVLAAHGIECSMSRRGDVWDNSAIESFFSTLKIERVHRRGIYRTRNEGKADVFDYIERFYNPRRRHSALGYMSPMEFEKQAMQT